ncbi:MAG: glycosyltransferase family 2 protein [Acidimicrobiales bacterium]
MPEAAALVTVGIPTYNREQGLVRAVESVLAQTHVPIDLVICDNASTDGTAQLCAELAARHPNIRYVRQDCNVGATGNFNRVFSEARGPYFMWLGDDDWIDVGYVAACLAALEADPSRALVAGTPVYHRADEVVRHGVVMNLDASRPAERVGGYFSLVEENGIFYGLARTEVLQKAMPLPNEMGGDWFVVARLAFLGGICTLPTVAVHRAIGGATRSLRHVAESAGLGRFQAAAPQLALAGLAARDIGWRSPVYAGLPAMERAALAARCSATVTRRFLPEAVRKWVRMRSAASHSGA